MTLRLHQLITAPTTYIIGMPALAPCPALTSHTQCEVAVVGAGYTGLACATLLARQGVSVALLEAGVVGAGPSGRNGGQMIPGFNLPQSEMRALFGHEVAHALWQEVEAKRYELMALASSTPDACDMQNGIIYAALNNKQLEQARQQSADLAQHHGYTQLRVIGPQEAQQTLSPTFIGGVEWADAKHLNPAKLIRLMRQQALEAGVLLFENSAVTQIEPEGQGQRLHTAGGSVSADQVVLCGGAGFMRPKGLSYKTATPTHTAIATFMLATEVCDAARILPSTAAICDLRNAMSYYRRMPDNRILYGGEVGLSLVDSRLMLRALEREMRCRLPLLAEVKIESAWAGQIDMTTTLLPSVRALGPNLYQADGFSAQGLVLTSLAGESIAREILAMRQQQHDRVFKLLELLKPPKVPKNKAFAMVAQGWRWLPKLLEDKWSA